MDPCRTQLFLVCYTWRGPAASRSISFIRTVVTIIRTVIMIVRTIWFLLRKVLQADAQDRTERNVNIVSIPKAQSRHRCAFAAQPLGAVQRCFVH